MSPAKFLSTFVVTFLLVFFSVARAADVAAIYNSAGDVPITASAYTAAGNSVSFTLNFAPATGSSLTVVKNTGTTFINGQFDDLAQGQTVILPYLGVNYRFVANYYGGSGRDLVLQWANVRPYAWGTNAFGALGNGSTAMSADPVPVDVSGVLSGKTIVALATGVGQSLALCADGTLAQWGLEVGSAGNQETTVPIDISNSGDLAGKHVIAIAAGAFHNLALCSDGTLISWGDNSKGQLGYPTSTTPTPHAMNNSGPLAGKTVIAIAAGAYHSLALCSDGSIFAWGYNYNGQLGNGNADTGDQYAPVQTVSSGALAGKTVTAIASGQYHSMALCSDGTLFTWGDNENGQLGSGTLGISREPVAVATDGVLAGKTVVAMAGGEIHSIALCSDGTLATWGQNLYGALGNQTSSWTDVPSAVDTSGALHDRVPVAITSGFHYNLVRCSDGTLVVWGQKMDPNNTQAYDPLPVVLDSSMLALGESWTAVVAGSDSLDNLALVAAPISPIEILTQAATGVTAMGATLNGAVNANNVDSQVFFEFGTDTNYGTQVAAAPALVTGSSNTAISATLTNLPSGVTYHYRAKRINTLGTIVGDDFTFTTPENLSTLSSLALSMGQLSPAFSSTALFYLAEVPNTTTSITVTPTATLGNASLSINLTPVSSGATSAPIDLQIGYNAIAIDVTSPDGTTQTHYSILVRRLTSLESWRLSNFGTSANSGNAADQVDFDGDGIPNLVEYAFGFDPKIPNSWQSPQPVINGNSASISFTVPEGRDDIVYGVQTTNRLGIITLWVDAPCTRSGNTFTCTVPIDGNTSIFFRLIVTESVTDIFNL